MDKRRALDLMDRSLEDRRDDVDVLQRFRADIERQTNQAALPLVEAVGPDRTARLIDLLKPVRRALLDGGAFAAFGR